MKFLYVKTRDIPLLLASRNLARDLDPWLAWHLDNEEADKLAIELKAQGYKAESGFLSEFPTSIEGV